MAALIEDTAITGVREALEVNSKRVEFPLQQEERKHPFDGDNMPLQEVVVAMRQFRTVEGHFNEVYQSYLNLVAQMEDVKIRWQQADAQMS